MKGKKDSPTQPSPLEILLCQFRENIPQPLSQFLNHLFWDTPLFSPGSQFRPRQAGTIYGIRVSCTVDCYFYQTFGIGWEDVESVIDVEVLISTQLC
jgi:hypothetical protein